jgi:hypothetical protein
LVPRDGRPFERVNAELVGQLLRKASSQSAPGDDRISAGILKVFWEWDQQRITQLVRACIRLGHHPELWKTAKGIVIPKAGKPDYSKVRAYRVICLLDVISKLVERTAGHLIADHLGRKKGCCGALAGTRFCTEKWSDWRSAAGASVRPPPSLLLFFL